MTSKVKLNVKGKNTERFIKRLKSNDIDILKIEYIKYNEINIIIYKKDYEKILNIKTIYDVNIVNIYGIIKVREVINIYKYLIFFILLGIFILIFLSNVIFNVEVIHNDKDLRNLIINELENYDIKKYKFKKNYNEIQNIKNEILNKYQDKIEWLEIEEKGTSYIVRVEPRIIPNNEESYEKQNIIASKSAILKKIILESGEVLKNINTYVFEGDVIISGNIYLNDEIKDTIKAEGTIYGEVWYNVKVEYPYIYSEIKETNNYQDVYSLKFLNKEFEFNLNKFNEKKVEEQIILKHTILPICLVRQHQQEIETESFVLTSEEAYNLAIKKGISKINETLDNDEKIIDYKVLNYNVEEDKVILDIFFTVYENITGYSKIEGE